MFDGMLINGLVLVVSLLILSRASHLSIENTVRAADAADIGKTTIRFRLMDFSTSLPRAVPCAECHEK